jgi:nucleotide-binding universal stress UspA family protein
MTTGLFKKILIATDGSDRNRAAVEEGVRIGRLCGSEVHAVYVADTSAFESTSAEGAMSDTWALLQSEAATTLARVSTLAAGVDLKTVILEGKAAAAIVKYAQKEEIDLIVIGTQGKRGFERFLLGSVAESVIRSAPCRVLVVK